MARLARPLSIAALAAASALAASASATPAAHLAGMPTAGTAPLVVDFDTAQSSAGTIAENLILVGNGDAVSLPMAAQTTNYDFTLPGFYLAQTWLRDDSGIALSAPVPIAVERQSDGLAPPTAKLTIDATTDPRTFAFMATVSATDGDPIAAQRWDFGDGTGDGAAAPFHTYASAGVYQAALVATTRAGLPLYARTVVVVRDAGGAVGPSLLVTASPEDASLDTPVTVTGYVQGVAPDAKVTSASVAWPDFVDASPTLTPTAAGLTLTSEHAVATAGSYDVPITLTLAAEMQPIAASVRVDVAAIDGSAPTPVVLAPPAATATPGSAYSPGTSSGVLLVAGDGPFAFGAAAPTPAGFTVDDTGHVAWTPTKAQLGFQRLSVSITDVNGNATVATWVVSVAENGKGGCAMAGGAAPSTAWPLALVVLALIVRRRATA